jgi:hypothetical protein
VLALNPFEEKSRWLKVAANNSSVCEKEICSRHAKERTLLLVDNYRKIE